MKRRQRKSRRRRRRSTRVKVTGIHYVLLSPQRCSTELSKSLYTLTKRAQDALEKQQDNQVTTEAILEELAKVINEMADTF